MAFVLDASVVLSWYFADEPAALASSVLDRLRQQGATAPVLWWFEVRNGLLISERRGRTDASQTAEILDQIDALPVRLDATQDSETVLALARAHRLTVYDAAYLELARRRQLPFATLDRALGNAARAAAVPLLG